MSQFIFQKKRGFILMNSVVFGMIAIIIIVGLTSWFGVTIKGSRDLLNREQAFHVAEAGVEYYRWHLAHDQDDYQDGTGQDGPFIHDFFDIEGNKIGEFSLNVIAPINGSTVVTVESTGYIEADPDISRTIRTKLAIPSFAKYAFAADTDMRFGEGTEVFGPVHSNGGIRFDGLAHNVVSSAKEKYDDPDHGGGNEFGVHTHVSPTDPLPPSAVPPRADVFETGREFPVPAVDFDGMISDLSTIKAEAISDGFYRGSSGKQGYHVVLRTDNMFDLYKVNSVRSMSSCTVSSQENWGSWSIDRKQKIGTYDLPSNGLMFFEDHVWVDGQINNARITIAAGRFPDTPSNRRSITINNDLKYTNYDGRDVVALIAQDNINIGFFSEDDLQIDAALLAQHGRVGRYYYWWACGSQYLRETITLNGMIGSKQRYGFAYTDNTGYKTRNINYDANLLYNPPPRFPLTSDQYEIISWEEVEE